MPVPRGGGFAIAIIVLIGFVLSESISGDMSMRAFWGFLLGATIIVVVSGLDDLWTMPVSLRLGAHLVAAIILVSLAGSVDRIEVPYIGTLFLGWAATPFTLLWVLGLTNAYNFMDGIDGIAAGQAIVAGGMWMIVAYSRGFAVLSDLSALIIGASAGFLIHNLPPAGIFMGDVGSVLLGYTFAALPVLAFRQGVNPRFMTAAVLWFAPINFYTTFTVIRRALNQENVFRAHQSHLYQRLVRRGMSHGSVSALYIALAAGLAALGALQLLRG
jgi:UDP-GlcNAc:undecaprenyl-phosphate/decaprenyl-phosphate GlcNAc-1-phosphate transferase